MASKAWRQASVREEKAFSCSLLAYVVRSACASVAWTDPIWQGRKGGQDKDSPWGGADGQEGIAEH